VNVKTLLSPPPKVKAIVAIALLAAGVAGCRAPSVRPTPAPLAPPSGDVPSRATRYTVDGAASMVHILVYRGGALARLGHNHVLSSMQLEGSVAFDPDVSRSYLELALPVGGLIVDDAQARASQGEDFVAAVPEEARQGTRANLLRAEVLDAEGYPSITLRSTHIEGSATAPMLTLQVTLKGQAREVVLPVQVGYGPNRLVATGAFSLKQTDFGITPFSAALGAIQVQDEVRIVFSIVAISGT